MQSWRAFVVWLAEDSTDVVLAAILVLLIFTALAWLGYRRWRLRYGSARWTMVEATIQTGYACCLGSNVWRPVLQYSYQVAGEFYSGYFMLFGAFIFHDDARVAARPWLEKRIFVRYNPERVHESVFLSADGAPWGTRSFGDQPPPSSDIISLSLK